jgi:hypothetical protein
MKKSAAIKHMILFTNELFILFLPLLKSCMPQRFPEFLDCQQDSDQIISITTRNHILFY